MPMNLYGGTAFYIAGLVLATFLNDHDLYRIAPCLAAALALFTTKRRMLPLFLALCLFSVGLNQFFLATAPRQESIFLQERARSEPLRLEGVVDVVNSRPDQALTIDLTSCRIMATDAWTELDAKIRVFIEKNDADLQPGDRVGLLTRLKIPRNFRTPGAFDYERYLRRRNIIASGFVQKSSDLARLRPGSHPTPTHAVRAWRNRIRNLVDQSVPVEMAPFIKALAIGDRGSMSREQRQLLSHGGLAHIFAISGLHLGLVASLLYLIGRSLYLRTFASRFGIPPRRFIPPLILPLLIGYMLFTGSAVSTLRALLMLTGAAMLCAMSRRSRPLDILVAAVFMILLVDPLALFEPAFQLSVAGAGGIIFFWPLWRPRLQKCPTFVRPVFGLFAVTVSATVMTLPFVLLHFHTLAPASPLLNLLAVPLVSFLLVPLILAAILASLLSTTAAAFLFLSAATVLELFLALTRQFVAIEPFSARILFFHPYHLLAAFILVILLCRPRFFSRHAKIAVSCIILMLFLAPRLTLSEPDALNLIALDVGQGEALVLQMPNGQNFLIDGGGLYSKSFDTGERLVAPALGYLGIDKLDAVILTHDHPDHSKGLQYILEHYPTDAFWHASPDKRIPTALSAVLAREKIPVRFFPPGWHPLPVRNAVLKLYVPGNDSDRLNDHSLVLYARHGHDGLLLTGDLEQAGIHELATSDEPGPVSLLKLPHHGSRRSDPGPLVAKFSPGLAFVSAGYENRYGLPADTILNNLSAAAVGLKRTDLDGSLIFTSEGRGWAIRHWKKGLFR